MLSWFVKGLRFFVQKIRARKTKNPTPQCGTALRGGGGASALGYFPNPMAIELTMRSSVSPVVSNLTCS